MNDKQRRRIERLVRCRDFTNAQQPGFPPESKGGKALANINAGITEIENLEASHSTNQRNIQHGTSSRHDAREALRTQILAYSKTAAAIALDFPDFKDKFRRPRSNINDQSLLGTARSFALEATPFKDRFIEYDMPADFLSRTNTLIDNFEQAINQQNLGRGGRQANSVAINAALDAAEDELERLDTAIHNKFAGDPAILSAWESARHVQSAPQKSKPPTPPK